MRRLGPAFVLSVLAGPALAGPDALEARLRTQLERLFVPEQFVLDVRERLDAPSASEQEPLPGLANLSAQREGGVDVLLIVDRGVSRDRQVIAEQLLNRQLEAAGIAKASTVIVRQAPMLKVTPPELRPPVPSAPTASPAPQAQGNPTPPAKEPTSLFDFIEGKRDLATKVFIALWAAAASLLAIFAIVGRLARSRSAAPRDPVVVSGGGSRAEGGASAEPRSARTKAATKDEIYSRDAALHKMAQELVEEAGRSPEKIATVIARWVEANDENARFASIFLKNCDMRTVESICKHLHPADAELVINRDTGELDPFGDENRKVLEQMRSEVARFAARGAIPPRPEPLQFLRQLTDDQLVPLLESESPRAVAMVATQVPAHRLSRYFTTVSEEVCRSVLALIPSVRDATAEEFESLRERLERRRSERSTLIVDAESCTNTARQVISSVGLAARQQRLARELQVNDPGMFASLRKSVLLADDIPLLPPRASKAFFQSIDGDVLAAALGDTSIDHEALKVIMPEAVREGFARGLERARDDGERQSAWREVQNVVESLVASGLVSANELAQAKARADEAINRATREEATAKGAA